VLLPTFGTMELITTCPFERSASKSDGESVHAPDGAAVTLMAYACVAVVVPFVTLMAKGYVPVAVGVPLISVVDAVEVPRVRPVGRVPEAMIHVNGPIAVPVAVSVCA